MLIGKGNNNIRRCKHCQCKWGKGFLQRKRKTPESRKAGLLEEAWRIEGRLLNPLVGYWD